MRRRGKLVIVPPMDYRVYVTPAGPVYAPCTPDGCPEPADQQAGQQRRRERRRRGQAVPA
jgi:hypothetical protein